MTVNQTIKKMTRGITTYQQIQNTITQMMPDILLVEVFGGGGGRFGRIPVPSTFPNPGCCMFVGGGARLNHPEDGGGGCCMSGGGGARLNHPGDGGGGCCMSGGGGCRLKNPGDGGGGCCSSVGGGARLKSPCMFIGCC